MSGKNSNAFDKFDKIPTVPVNRPFWDGKTNFYLWLPSVDKPLVNEFLTQSGYSSFDTFSHATTYMKASTEILSSTLIHRKVTAESAVSNNAWNHPLRTKKMLWFGPDLHSNNGPIELYGNIKYEMKNVTHSGGMLYEGAKFYFVEVIDYFTQSACRILVTPQTYPELREYNPYQVGGPWFIDGQGNHFHLTEILNRKGKKQPNTLEIMREEHNSEDLVRNLDVSYVICNPSGWNVDTVDPQVIPTIKSLVDASKFTWKMCDFTE